MGVMGHRGHGEHTNKERRGHLGSHRPGFGPYGRGNFPGHDVLWCLSKMVKNGCRWVAMDADGRHRACNHERQKKQGKKSPKCTSWACFGMHGHGQEMYHVGGCVIVACRESKEAKKGEQGLQCSV